MAVGLEDEKIVTLSEFEQRKNLLKGKRIVLVGGCFDLFHFGHLSFLQRAKQEGEVLIVALESDESCKRLKKRDPVHTQDQRAQILAALKIVDLVIMLPLFSSDEEYGRFTKIVSPHTIAVTENDPQIKTKQTHANMVGGVVQIVSPVVENFSSTRLASYAAFSGD